MTYPLNVTVSTGKVSVTLTVLSNTCVTVEGGNVRVSRIVLSIVVVTAGGVT